MSTPYPLQHREHGFTLIEVLVTAIVLAIGLLGLAALQTRMVGSELEAYQRAQALILLADMTDRINSNSAAFKATFESATTPLTAGTDDGRDINQDCSVLASVARELCFWSRELKGVAVTFGSGSEAESIGAIREARGCIERIGASRPITLRVSVVWQGMTPTLPPPAELTCGATVPALSGENATVRRVAHVLVTLADLASL